MWATKEMRPSRLCHLDRYDHQQRIGHNGYSWQRGWMCGLWDLEFCSSVPTILWDSYYPNQGALNLVCWIGSRTFEEPGTKLPGIYDLLAPKDIWEWLFLGRHSTTWATLSAPGIPNIEDVKSKLSMKLYQWQVKAQVRGKGLFLNLNPLSWPKPKAVTKYSGYSKRERPSSAW
jgi:hypothetical protein